MEFDFLVFDCHVTEEISSFHGRKNLMEAELVRSKNDMMSLNNQLLEAIQRKLELSQELEAWQVRSHPVDCVLSHLKSCLVRSLSH